MFVSENVQAACCSHNWISMIITMEVTCVQGDHPLDASLPALCTPPQPECLQSAAAAWLHLPYLQVCNRSQSHEGPYYLHGAPSNPIIVRSQICVAHSRHVLLHCNAHAACVNGLQGDLQCILLLHLSVGVYLHTLCMLCSASASWFAGYFTLYLITKAALSSISTFC